MFSYLKPNNKKMNIKNITSISAFLVLGIFIILSSCSNTAKEKNTSAELSTSKKEAPKTVYASDITPFFDDCKLILGDGSNVGHANNFEHKDFFYTINDGKSDWVVYKTPNAGSTHGSSNNTRTELAQAKKWYPATAACTLGRRSPKTQPCFP